MSRRTSTADYVSLTAEDMAVFHRHAPAAVQRRSGGFIAESFGRSFELIVLGATPIFGMLWWDWSAAQLLVFLLAGAWIGIACDLARLTYAGRGVQQFGNTHYEDWHVWVVVEALRAGRTTAPRSHLQAKYDPWMGAVVDILAGGMATLIIVFMFINGGVEGEKLGVLEDSSFVISLGCLAMYQAVEATWEIARHRRGGRDAGPVEAKCGMRGLGLFVLVFVMMIVGDPDSGSGLAARRVMLAVNGAIILFGVLNTAGLLWLGPETNWLRNYLRDRPIEVETAPPAKKGRKRKKKSNGRRS